MAIQVASKASQAAFVQDLTDRGITARADLDTSKASLSALNATVAADRAALENAQVQLEYATINAPLTGRTGALQVHEGNLVRANDSSCRFRWRSRSRKRGWPS